MLLPLLSRKLKRTVPALISHPSLLAHTIYQSLGFDASLVEEGFGLAGTSAGKNPSGGWDGISDIILGNKEWFEAWIDGERKCENGIPALYLVSSLLIDCHFFSC